MKKLYVSPSMEIITVNAANIIAASMQIFSETTVDTSEDGVQLGREDVSSPSLWEQGW